MFLLTFFSICFIPPLSVHIVLRRYAFKHDIYFSIDCQNSLHVFNIDVSILVKAVYYDKVKDSSVQMHVLVAKRQVQREITCFISSAHNKGPYLNDIFLWR